MRSELVMLLLGAVLWAIACSLTLKLRERLAIFAFAVLIVFGSQYQWKHNERGRTPTQREEDAQGTREAYE